MIRLSYALKLARTKLHSKRGVLTTSVIVASLLFATLIAIVIVFTGAEKSATTFIKKAGNDRYLVMTSPNIPFDQVDFQMPLSLDQVRAIKAYEKTYYEKLRIKYKSLGLDYDKSTEVSALTPASWMPATLPEEQRVSINWSSPVIEEMRNSKFATYAKTATNKLSDLEKIGEKYGARGYYIVNEPGVVSSFPSLRLVRDNKEDFTSIEMRQTGATPQDTFAHAIENGLYSVTDQKLLNRYLLTTDVDTLKGIPVVVSAQEAASLFGSKNGIGKEPDSAADKRAWLLDVQAKLSGQMYQACYRNSTEQVMLQKIQQDYAEMESNKGTIGYQKPHLIYAYPADPCGDIVIKEDTRTVAEKQADAKSELIKRKLGTYVAPSHHLMTFQIVGIRYAQPFTDYTKDINEYLKSLLVSENASMVIEIPKQMYESLPDSLKIDTSQQEDAARTIRYLTKDEDFTSRVLEFATVEDARSFLDKETCLSSDSSCTKKFYGSPYGSNYLILDEIGKLFNRFSTIAFPVVLSLAVIIIWFTVSRILAENRKETAVYRAMGAKRGDVTGIYFIYVLLVALQIVIASIAFGIAAAYAIDHFYGQTLTDTAVTAFGIIDEAPMFSLFRLDSPLLLVIAGSIFIISLIASIQPLIRNIRRSPIQDLRDE